jgi:sec-independent protein translocase protein TatA
MYPVFGFLDNPVTLLVLGALAVLLFGERLPEVARSIGKGLMEVKKGVHGIQQEIENAVNSATQVDASSGHSSPYQEPADREEATAPKFEPPPAP